jgi:hypothetical protein
MMIERSCACSVEIEDMDLVTAVENQTT